jgi:hypothetical protein
MRKNMLKINNFRGFYKFVFLIVVMSSVCAAAFGQQSGQLAQPAAQAENTAKLREYGWKSRTEIRKGGETKSVQLNQMRYDLDGTLQKTPLSATQLEIPTGGLRGLIARKKREEFLQTLDGLGALAKSYASLPPEKMQRFIGNAVITPEKTARQNLLRIQSKDVLQPGDSMTVWIDPLSRRQRKTEIQTTFESKPVRIFSEFQDLPNGPTYMARSRIDYPEMELAITTENFEYARNTVIKAGGAK